MAYQYQSETNIQQKFNKKLRKKKQKIDATEIEFNKATPASGFGTQPEPNWGN